MYKKLVFKSLEDLHQDVDLFNKKQHIRQNVRNLSILNMEHDVHTAITLPTLFPKVTSLEWSKTFSYRYARDSEVRPKLVFVGALQQWKNIESLVDCTKHLNIAARLLESTQCDRLTLLKISLEDWDDDNNIMHRDLLQELIDHIHNAPSLEHVSFNATAIILSDMEKLRASLSKLNSVALQEVYLYPTDSVPNISQIPPKTTMESFSMEDFYGQDDGIPTNAACNWISYVGATYRNLQKLDWTHGYIHELDVDQGMIQQALTSTITKMTHISSFRDNICDLSEPLLKLTGKNNIELEKLMLKIEENNAQVMYRSLDVAKLIATLKSLEMHFYIQEEESLTASAGLVHLCKNNLKLLAHLTIFNGGAELRRVIIVDILQNLPSLESLAFTFMEIFDLDADLNRTLTSKLDVVNRCRLN